MPHQFYIFLFRVFRSGVLDNWDVVHMNTKLPSTSAVTLGQNIGDATNLENNNKVVEIDVTETLHFQDPVLSGLDFMLRVFAATDTHD